MKGRVVGTSPKYAFYVEPGDADPTTCRHEFYFSCVGNYTSPGHSEIHKYVCIHCGEYQREYPWPCVEMDGAIEDRAARIPIGEM